MSDKNFEIYDLRVNQIAEALGLDVEKPVFSWKLKSEKQNTMQTKAQILVGKTDRQCRMSGIVVKCLQMNPQELRYAR